MLRILYEWARGRKFSHLSRRDKDARNAVSSLSCDTTSVTISCSTRRQMLCWRIALLNTAPALVMWRWWSFWRPGQNFGEKIQVQSGFIQGRCQGQSRCPTADGTSHRLWYHLGCGDRRRLICPRNTQYHRQAIESAISTLHPAPALLSPLHRRNLYVAWLYVAIFLVQREVCEDNQTAPAPEADPRVNWPDLLAMGAQAS